MFAGGVSDVSAVIAVSVAQALHALGSARDEAPDPEDVTAGWTGFVVFLLLIAAVVVLGFSLVKQLRKAEAARQAGVFGPVDDEGAGAGPDGGADGGADEDTGTDAGSEPRQSP